MTMRSTILSLAVLLLAGPIACNAEDQSAQAVPEEPCSRPEFRQFDFWIGQWDLTWADSGKGENIITAELDSCVIEENFTTLDGQPFRGNSLSTFDTHLGKWKQTWVDNRGAYLDFVGEFNDGKMILSREKTEKDGKKVLQRMVWHNIAPNSLDWNWERSDDNGETWTTLWAIHYERRQ